VRKVTIGELEARTEMQSKPEKKKQILKKSNIYDLDNFIIHSSSNKLIQAETRLEIMIPKFKLLDAKFYQTPSFIIKKNGRNNHENNSPEEKPMIIDENSEEVRPNHVRIFQTKHI
jgi:hypothetical protein